MGTLLTSQSVQMRRALNSYTWHDIVQFCSCRNFAARQLGKMPFYGSTEIARRPSVARQPLAQRWAYSSTMVVSEFQPHVITQIRVERTMSSELLLARSLQHRTTRVDDAASASLLANLAIPCCL